MYMLNVIKIYHAVQELLGISTNCQRTDGRAGGRSGGRAGGGSYSLILVGYLQC